MCRRNIVEKDREKDVNVREREKPQGSNEAHKTKIKALETGFAELEANSADIEEN
jgi:hypothetical protein